jgi:AraC family transcriptional regulator of adaptative response / DNA-3-methyladenine glycosylase II
MLDPDRCYAICAARDRRFAGRFVIAVRTTGIYCRPGCPARLPRRENVEFYATPAEARARGFRACLRCHPDAAAEAPATAGTATTVARALRLISGGALDGAGLPALAGRLGIGPRHLTRLFRAHAGTTPAAVARARRVELARQLLEETDLPVAQVALAAGFRSIRRFNEAMRAALRSTPGALRARRRAGGRATELAVRVPHGVPLDWDALLSFLAARAVPGVERVESGRYLRTVATAGGPAVLTVSRAPEGAALLVALSPPRPEALLELIGRVRRLFDLDANPAAVAAALGRDPLLGPSVAARPGLRVPGAWDSFELLVRAVVGQQISVAAAVALLGRLTALCGAPLPAEAAAPGLTHLFPAASAVARLEAAALPMPRVRAAALVAAAAEVARDGAALQPGASLEDALARLVRFPGVGPWTAQLVAMRALGEPDAFPAGDLGIRRALGAPGLPCPEPAALARAEAWRPWRAYAAQHLWTLDAQARARPRSAPIARAAPSPRRRAEPGAAPIARAAPSPRRRAEPGAAPIARAAPSPRRRAEPGASAPVALGERRVRRPPAVGRVEA